MMAGCIGFAPTLYRLTIYRLCFISSHPKTCQLLLRIGCIGNAHGLYFSSTVCIELLYTEFVSLTRNVSRRRN